MRGNLIYAFAGVSVGLVLSVIFLIHIQGGECKRLEKELIKINKEKNEYLIYSDAKSDSIFKLNQEILMIKSYPDIIKSIYYNYKDSIKDQSLTSYLDSLLK